MKQVVIRRMAVGFAFLLAGLAGLFALWTNR